MPRLETKSHPFQLKSASSGGEGCEFKGVVAPYLNIDHEHDMFVPGCHDAHIGFFQEEGVVRDEHLVTTGKITAATTSKAGLLIEAQVHPTTAGKDQAILLRTKTIRRLSLGALNSGRWCDDPEEIRAIWQQHDYKPSDDDLMRLAYGVRLITTSKPYEASTTFAPMNGRASITSVKSQDPQARPALSYDAHSETTLALVEEFTDRCQRLATLRAGQDRRMSHKSLAKVRQLRDALDRLLATPQAPAEPDQVAQLHAQFLALEARIKCATTTHAQ